MIQIKYTIRPFIKANGQVAVRVRWNNNTSEVTFITGVYAERDKWDDDGHRAVKNTTHKFEKREYRSYEINDRIADFREAIEEVMSRYSLKNSVPTNLEFRTVTIFFERASIFRFLPLNLNSFYINLPKN